MSRTEQVKKVKNAEPDKKILFHRSFLNIYYISDPVLIRLNTLSGQTLPERPLTTRMHSAFMAKVPVFIVYILEFHTRRNRREIILSSMNNLTLSACLRYSANSCSTASQGVKPLLVSSRSKPESTQLNTPDSSFLAIFVASCRSCSSAGIVTLNGTISRRRKKACVCSMSRGSSLQLKIIWRNPSE